MTDYCDFLVLKKSNFSVVKQVQHKFDKLYYGIRINERKSILGFTKGAALFNSISLTIEKYVKTE